MPAPSSTPARASIESGRRGHQGITCDRMSMPAAPCEAPAEPWHLHSEPSEIAPATDDHCLRTLQTRAGDILIVGRSALARSASTARCNSNGARIVTRTGRCERCGPAARAPSMSTRALRPLCGRRSRQILRLPGPLLTFSLAQVDEQVTWLSAWPARGR